MNEANTPNDRLYPLSFKLYRKCEREKNIQMKDLFTTSYQIV